MHGAVTEQRGDCFESHAAVDGLGGEGVAELVGVDGDAGAASDAAHDAGECVSVEAAAVIGDESIVGADVVEVVGGPAGEEGDEVGVEWDVAVVAEFADRDA